MADSFPIDFVIRGGQERTVLEEIAEKMSDNDNYSVDWRDDETSLSLARHTTETVFSTVLTGYEIGSPNRSYTLPSTPGIEMRAFVDELTIGDDVSKRVSLLIDLVEAVYTASNAIVYGYALDTEHVGSIGADWGPDRPVSDESLADDRIEDVSWLMLFGPELADEYGREWLLSAPAWKRREFDDGGIVLVASPDPTDHGTFTEGRDRLRNYFDIG